jgi:hypothetical protein
MVLNLAVRAPIVTEVATNRIGMKPANQIASHEARIKYIRPTSRQCCESGGRFGARPDKMELIPVQQLAGFSALLLRNFASDSHGIIRFLLTTAAGMHVHVLPSA